MRHLLYPQPPRVIGCSVLYKKDCGTPFGLAHCQNYLFLLWGVPISWLYIPQLPRIVLLGTGVKIVLAEAPFSWLRGDPARAMDHLGE